MEKTTEQRLSDIEITVQGIKTDTAEIIEFFATAKSAIKFLVILGKVVKWLAGIAGAVAVVYGLYVSIRNGVPSIVQK